MEENKKYAGLFPAWAMALAVCLCGLFACSDKEEVTVPVHEQEVKKVKVAVLMDKEQEARWRRVTAWANENLAKAQAGLDCRVELVPEFYVQNGDDDFSKRVRALVADTALAAIVGPTDSRKAQIAARILSEKDASHKPMIAPCATQTDFQRKYADKPYIWNMAESYVAELETLLATIAQKTYPKTEGVALVSSITDKDYIEWFSFLAQEYGVKVVGLHTYSTPENLRQIVKENFVDNWSSKDVIFHPADLESCLAFDEQYSVSKEQLKEEYGGQSGYNIAKPYFYCTGGFVQDTIAATVKNFYRGIDLYADVETGFDNAYRLRFSEDLSNGEAQLYDALMLVAYGATLSNHTKKKLETSIGSILAENDGLYNSGSGWLPSDIAINFSNLSQGKISNDICGASGSWQFDGENHTNAHESTYRAWKFSNSSQGFVTLGYTSSALRHSDASTNNIWDQIASKADSTFDITGNIPTYPELHSTWALLVAGSKGWENYRFQADVFAMYQMLKENGFDDDHIVLICEDDLVGNPKNKTPGELRVSPDGPNVYDHAAIDYKLSDLSPDDIGAILQGKKSQRLPHVIEATDKDNIFVFWSSHGSFSGNVDFGTTRKIDYKDFRSYLAGATHRKILLAVEACYSGGLGEACEGIPGLLAITAANPYETSHADVWSYDLQIYLSNSFTRGFKNFVDNKFGNVRDLYFTLARTIHGSHPKLYNLQHYGNVYNEYVQEFLIHWDEGETAASALRRYSK